jgi:single-stranded DNA-specific DHH superfamily exonuclease
MEFAKLVDETIKPGRIFITSIKPKNKVVIVCGHDLDSLCSAALTYKLIKDLHKTDSQFVISESNSALEEKTLKKIKIAKPKFVIIVDIPEIRVDLLTQLRNLSNVLIIDHHVPKGYVKVTYVNPRTYDREIYLPATYLCYKIYESFFNPKDIAWIAGIGTLADNGMKNCIDLFGKIKGVNKELVDDLGPNDEILFEKSMLGKLAFLVESMRTVKGLDGAESALDRLVKIKNYKGLLKDRELARCFALSEKEFKRIVDDFNKNKKAIKNFLLYEIKSKYNLKSQLASHLQRFFPDKILIVYQKTEGFLDLSFRRGKNVETDLDKLARDIIKDIPNSVGGGHTSAAGSKIPIKYEKKLIDNLKQF